jgi:hypothetical protein
MRSQLGNESIQNPTTVKLLSWNLMHLFVGPYMSASRQDLSVGSLVQRIGLLFSARLCRKRHVVKAPQPNPQMNTSRIDHDGRGRIKDRQLLVDRFIHLLVHVPVPIMDMSPIDEVLMQGKSHNIDLIVVGGTNVDSTTTTALGKQITKMFLALA